MKRVKNIVIGGIASKIFNLILITVILLTAAFSVVSLVHSNMLSQLAEESGKQQKDSIQTISGTVMDALVERTMNQSLEQEAFLSDDMFHGLKLRVEMLGDYAGKLLSEPNQYPRKSYAAPDPDQDGKVVSQLIYADGVDTNDQELKDRIGLIANMSDLMISLFGISAETNSCFVALPDGVFLVTDDRSSSKFDESGKQISYDPRTRPWYQMAVENEGLIFTDVETDAFTGDIGIVCAMPVYIDGRLAAVVGSDLFLTSMQERVATMDEYGNFNCVINQNGHVVFSPWTEGTLQVLPSSEAEDLRQSSDGDMAKLIGDAMQNETDLRKVSVDGKSYYMIGAPLETVGWALISACSVEAAEKPAEMLKDSYEQIQADTAAVYQSKTDKSRLTATILLIVVAAAMLVGAAVLAKRIVKPLNTITKKISLLSEGNLEFKMEDTYKTGDEIEELARSFASISHRTVEYMEEIRQVTAEKERISTELSLATDIQNAMLPHIFPAFPEREDFDLYASMDPAKEVGGDFYDYFLIDEDHLCVLIADVSGKGIPAALFMMASKIILQNCAMLGYSAADILAKTNEALCSNNEAEMFVTVWLGILELSTGRMTAANAGHEYPVLKHKNGNYELIKDKHGFVIGGMENMRYNSYELELFPGSCLFIYTDGVPEATNAEQEQFGTSRLLDALNKQPDASPQVTLENVKSAVEVFVQDAEQFDDLTMLCLEYKGTRT